MKTGRKIHLGIAMSALLILCYTSQAAVLETVYVDSGDFDPVSSSTVLTEGKSYLLEARGTYSIDTSNIQDTDAEWYWGQDVSEPVEHNYGTGWQGDLIINGAPVDWMGTTDDVVTCCSVFEPSVFSVSHIYRYVIVGDGNTVNFKVYDGPEDGARYLDNQGVLEVDIIECDKELTLLEEFSVDSQNCYTTESVTTLRAGVEYIIEATGTYSIDTSNIQDTDAEWYWGQDAVDPPVEHHYGTGWQGDLLINGAPVDWMGTSDLIVTSCSVFEPHVYSPTHTYRYYLTGNDEILSCIVYDGDECGPRYNDNNGILTVKIILKPNANYHVDVVNGDDNNDGLTKETAFKTTQRGITEAIDCDTVLVWPGVYNETVDFAGKAITVQSAADAAVITNVGGYGVRFHTAEGAGSVLENFVIRDCNIGIQTESSSPTIDNVTVVNNNQGIVADGIADPTITNSIFWDNASGDLIDCTADYSCIESTSVGVGNISVDPCFADPCDDNYHLKSEQGRFWPEDPMDSNEFGDLDGLWAMDSVTSPCVDAGDPTIDPSGEGEYSGGRVNMGAYGGTAYASRSDYYWPLEGDVNRDGIVNLADFAIVSENWLDSLP